MLKEGLPAQEVLPELFEALHDEFVGFLMVVEGVVIQEVVSHVVEVEHGDHQGTQVWGAGQVNHY